MFDCEGYGITLLVRDGLCAVGNVITGINLNLGEPVRGYKNWRRITFDCDSLSFPRSKGGAFLLFFLSLSLFLGTVIRVIVPDYPHCVRTCENDGDDEAHIRAYFKIVAFVTFASTRTRSFCLVIERIHRRKTKLPFGKHLYCVL